MSLVVGVRFADAGKLYYYDPGTLRLGIGDCVLVETPRGMELGEVVLGPREVADTAFTSALPRVAKRADDRDMRRLEQNVQREEEAFRICEQKIRKRKMPMKLIDAEYTFDGSKLIFYFAADGRVDFRELVKELASVFRTRIELRQIGVRDEAKKIGGLGPCGRPACCNAFLGDFTPVSIKMAKEQNLSLSPTKISGLCGRLMCCLHYEHEHYREMHKRLPRLGAIVETPDGACEVIETDPLGGRIKGKITLADGSFELRRYSLEDIGQVRQRRDVKSGLDQQHYDERPPVPRKGRADRGDRKSSSRSSERPQSHHPERSRDRKQNSAAAGGASSFSTTPPSHKRSDRRKPRRQKDHGEDRRGKQA